MKKAFLLALAGMWLLAEAGCNRAATPTTAGRAVAKTAPLPEADLWRLKRQKGIDFVASGITPAEWSMDIDFAKQIIFKPLSGSTLIATMPRPQPVGLNSGVLLAVGPTAVRNEAGLLASAGKKAYAARAAGGLRVYIDPVITRNTLTGRTYAYAVRVEANGRRYVGHGAFIRGADRLNGTWTLESLRGQRVRASQFPSGQLPQLTISLTTNALEGTTGCNRIGGTVQADGDQVKFVVRNTTSKKCTSTFDDDYLTALSQSTLFRIGKDRLTLLANGEYALTFLNLETTDEPVRGTKRK